MLSYQFYVKSVKIRLSYKNLIKRIKVGRKVLRYFKRRLFLVNPRVRSSRQLKSSFFIRRLCFKRSFLPNLKNFRSYCSPVLLSKCFLKKKYLSKKRYTLKRKLLYTKRFLNRKNFANRKRRFYTNFRKKRTYFSYKFGGWRGRGGRYKKSLLNKYPVYYSFKGLFARAKLIRRVFNIVFTKVLLQKLFFKQSFFSKILRRRRLLCLKKLFMPTPAQFFFNQNKLLSCTKNYKKKTFTINRLYNSSTLLKYFFSRKKINFKSRMLYTGNLLHCAFKRLVSALYSYNNQRSLLRVSLLASKKKKRFFSTATKKLRIIFLSRRVHYPMLSVRSRKLVKKKFKMSSLRFFRNKHKSLNFWRTLNRRLISSYFLQRSLAAFKCRFFLQSFYMGKRARYGTYTFIRKNYFRRYVNKLLVGRGKLVLKNINKRLKKKYLARLYCTFLIKSNISFVSSRLKLLPRNKIFFLRNNKNKFSRYRKNYKLLKKIKKLSIKSLCSFSKQKNKLLRQYSTFFDIKASTLKSTFFVPPFKIKLFTKKKWILKKNFEFFMSEFLQLIVGLPTTVFFSDGLTLFNKIVHADRILALKLVFKRAFISKKNFFFFKNFVNLLFQAVFFKTIWSITRYFSRVYYYRKTQKHTTQTLNRVFKTLDLRTIRFVGVNILISGKIGRRRRAKSICFTKNKLPNLACLSLKVQYCYTQCITNFGVYGIKM